MSRFCAPASSVFEAHLAKIALRRVLRVRQRTPKRLKTLIFSPFFLFFGAGPYPKSLFGKVYTPLASRLSIRRIMATSMKVSLLCTFRS